MNRFFLFIPLIALVSVSSCRDEVPVHTTSFQSGQEVLNSFASEPTTYFASEGEFISNSGVGYSFPQDSFDLEVDLTEYWYAKEMMFANLYTESAGQPIISEGAFAMKIIRDGISYQPSRIEIRVPDETRSSTVQLFVSDFETESVWTTLGGLGYAQFMGGIDWRLDLGLNGAISTGYRVYLNLIDDYFSENETLFINHDYFLNSEIPLTDISIRPSSDFEFDPNDLTMGLLFTAENMVLSGIWNPVNSLLGVANVPSVIT